MEYAEVLKAYEVPGPISADYGVGHIWTNVKCPAYKSRLGRDCTCDNLACRNKAPHVLRMQARIAKVD